MSTTIINAAKIEVIKKIILKLKMEMAWMNKRLMVNKKMALGSSKR